VLFRSQAAASVVCVLVNVLLMVFSRMTDLLCLSRY